MDAQDPPPSPHQHSSLREWADLIGHAGPHNGHFDPHAIALAATRQFLTQRIDIKAVEALRAELELPPEALGALIDIYAKEVEKTRPRPQPASREVLPLSTDKAIRHGECAEITARPQRVAFKPERLFVSNSTVEYKSPWWKRLSPWYKAPVLKGASDWLIHDVKIGNRSQFSQAGTIPGDTFLSTAHDNLITFETAQTAMDVKVIVEYIGACPTGQRFYGAMIGLAAL